MRRYLSILAALLLVTVTAAAQGTTRVRGTVKDAETGEPLPFVGVYFDGTTIGISTDMDGHYSLETRSQDAKVLTAQLIGYESLSIPIQTGSFSEINFILRPDPKQLNAAYVKPDNRYIKSILRRISDNLEVHDPDNAPDWSSRLYSKIEIDVTNMDDLMNIGFIDRHMGFMKNYADTSAITGQSFIPALISENVSDLYHSQDPQFQREVMRYSHMSGFDANNNVLRQYTGAHLLRANFYKRSLSFLNLEIPNPVASTSQIFYNYYLVDSLQVDQRKTYVLRFHPKKLVTSPTLDGEMHIDAEDFGIRSVHAALSKNANVNWVRHINMDIENRRDPEGRWFFGDERLFIDFSIASSDSSRILSFLGRRQLSFEEPDYGPIQDRDALTSTNQVVERNVKEGSQAQWAVLRPYPLAAREQGIFDMVEDFQKTRFYKNSYGLAHALFGGYIQIPALGFELGPWPQWVAFNETEGVRLQMGGRTYPKFSEVVRLGGYFAYGLRDKTPKWQARAEVMLGRERTRKLSFTARHDFSQFGSADGLFSSQTVVTSLAARSHTNLQSMVRAFDLLYEHEFAPSVNASLEWTSARVWGNDRVPFIRPDGSLQESFSAHTLHGSLRFSKDERVTRNVFKKTYLYTKYPILTLDVMGGIKGITKDDISFLSTTANIYWKIPSHALGFGQLYLEGGSIWGSIPYPLLKQHPSNRSYFMDRSAFSLMDYYEFVSDRWLSGYYEHNFNGFFLGKIPLIKKLDLREVVTARFAWGTLSKANRENAPFLLPPGAGTLETPYVELGAGISNIFRVIRIDCFWRVTHRHPEAKRNFTVNVGFDVDF